MCVSQFVDLECVINFIIIKIVNMMFEQVEFPGCLSKQFALCSLSFWYVKFQAHKLAVSKRKVLVKVNMINTSLPITKILKGKLLMAQHPFCLIKSSMMSVKEIVLSPYFLTSASEILHL